MTIVRNDAFVSIDLIRKPSSYKTRLVTWTLPVDSLKGDLRKLKININNQSSP